jgi:hypothetical protein
MLLKGNWIMNSETHYLMERWHELFGEGDSATQQALLRLPVLCGNSYSSKIEAFKKGITFIEESLRGVE